MAPTIAHDTESRTWGVACCGARTWIVSWLNPLASLPGARFGDERTACAALIDHLRDVHRVDVVRELTVTDVSPCPGERPDLGCAANWGGTCRRCDGAEVLTTDRTVHPAATTVAVADVLGPGQTGEA